MKAVFCKMIQYLALGDSYTIGELVATNERWPYQMREMLLAKGIHLSEPLTIATTGWTTDELSKGIDEAKIEDKKFDLVSLLIGVNNQYRGRSVENYVSELNALIDRAIAFADGDASRVFMVSIPDWGHTPFAAENNRDKAQVASEIDAYNAAKANEASKRGIHFVDITPISRELHDNWLASDQLHPGAAQYTAWAKKIAPVVASMLQV
jgi:lysophospholipase L1-like esterase